MRRERTPVGRMATGTVTRSSAAVIWWRLLRAVATSKAQSRLPPAPPLPPTAPVPAVPPVLLPPEYGVPLPRMEDLPPAGKKRGPNRYFAHIRAHKQWKQGIQGYLASIYFADAMVGRVLDTLESGPNRDNTIVVLWSDHGYHHGEKYDWGKHTLWERTSNVPFIWAGPGVEKGAMSDVTVSLIDMYPTFVEMCGLPRPRQKRR